MPIIRGHHSFDGQFTQIPNAWLRDSRLSLKAIGLLAQILSHQSGWSMSLRLLAKQNGTGLGTIKSAAEELEKAGYLVRSDIQSHAEDGTFAGFTWVTCDPQPVDKSVDKAFQNRTGVPKPHDGEMEHKEEQLNKNIKSIAIESFSSDWQPDNEFAIQMQLKYPQSDISVEAEKMVDYYLGTGKAKEVKDVKARFRTWMRNADKFSGGVLSKPVESFGLPQIGPKL
jgi:DNA-binding transcriptional MocR family regulator